MSLDRRQLEQSFLPFVAKPGRYFGGEQNLPPLPQNPDLRVSLAFPDLYELGMSYLGLRILLHRASQIEGVACERVFMPWFDAEKRLRELRLPLFTLESRTPLGELDLIGFNVQYELHATNILAMLDLAGIPLRAAQRSEDDPIVIAGGPLAFHPEPFAPFFDAIAVGDGEDLFPDVLLSLKTGKQAGTTRREKLRALGDIPGIYLPGFYEPQYGQKGEYSGLKRTDDSLPPVIEARITPRLLPQHYPARPIVPLIEATHNRLVLEIARGCSRGCRFCGPGMVHRPVRERPIADLLKEAEQGLDATGFSQVSLLSLSTADYSRLEVLLDALAPLLDQRQASLSFPSLRPDHFTPQMADRAAAGARTGLTLAPEAATPRLRAVVNKETSDEDLLNAIRLAFERHWKSVKLYFMIGLPTETDEDIYALADLVKRAVRLGKDFGGRSLNVSISPFSPKPNTPFERNGQFAKSDLARRIGILKSHLQKYHSVRLEFRDLDVVRIETAIARGDRRTADAIEKSYQAGGLFDAWTDGFSIGRWEEAYQRAGLALNAASAQIPDDAVKPWGHIEPGISAEFLEEEVQAAQRGEYTPDCRSTGQCHLCGLQSHPDLPCPEIFQLERFEPAAIIPGKPVSEIQRYRLIYRREAPSRYMSHLDTLDALERALRRLRVPIEFTQGMKPHPRLIASPPLPLGMTSCAEYLDFGIAQSWSEELMIRLQTVLPPGFEAVGALLLAPGGPSLGGLNIFLYRAELPASLAGSDYAPAIRTLLGATAIPIVRSEPKRARAFDARPSLWKLEQESRGFILIGLKSAGIAIPRVSDILGLLMPDSGPENPIALPMERLAMWWETDGERRSPDDITKLAASSANPMILGEKR